MPNHLGITVPGSGSPRTLFNPLIIPGLTGLIGWWDATRTSSLWQNTAGTTRVTAYGQSVARMDDLSGNGRHMLQGGVGAGLYQAGKSGFGCVEVTGTNEWYTAGSHIQSAAGFVTMLAVYQMPAYSAGIQTPIGSLSNATPANTTGAIRRTSANTVTFSSYDGVGAIIGDSETATDGQWHIAIGTFGTGANLLMRVDGAGTQTVGGASPSLIAQSLNLCSRASSGADLMIGKMVMGCVWDNKIGATNIAAIESQIRAQLGAFPI